MGWLTLATGLAYAFYKFMDIDSKSHPVSDTLVNFAFYKLLTGAIC